MGENVSKADAPRLATPDPGNKGTHVFVGPFTFDFSRMELRRGGVVVHVQEMPLRLLAILLERPGDLFSREELRRRLWPSDTFLDFEHSINSSIRKLRDALGDHAEQPEFIETVSRHGYRLIAPASGPSGRQKRLRLVVLPFENLNAEQGDCLSTSLTEALITQLGRKCSMLDVIAPIPILHDKNPLELRPESLPNYLLWGSLLHSKEQVRITVRLVRNEDQCCLWCESYTRMHPEYLLVQDEVAASVAQAVLTACS